MFDALGVTADGVFVLGWGYHSSHTDQEQTFEESLEEVVGVDDPERRNLVYGDVQLEEQICQYLQVVADPVQLLQTLLGISESR